MSWLLTCDTERSVEAGVRTRQDRLLTQGTLVIEFERKPGDRNSKRLIQYSGFEGWHRGFTVFLNPDGSVSVEHVQGRTKSYVRVSRSGAEAGRTRISYAWDGPERLGALTVECLESGAFKQAIFRNPLPLPARDGRSMILGVKKNAHDECVSAMALSDRWERIGPAPTIAAGTLVDTPDGARPIQTLQLGDLVTTRSHGDQKLRWILRGQRPNVGFDRAVRVSAPALGLESDLVTTGRQRLELPVDQVQQLLGEDIATIEAAALGDIGDPVTGISLPSFQLLFDMHDCIRVNGVWAEATYVGRLAASRDALAGTWFSKLSAHSLPTHHMRVAPPLEQAHPDWMAEFIA